MLKRVLSNCLFAPLLVIVVMACFRFGAVYLYGDESIGFYSHESEFLTYSFYALAGIVALYFAKDYIGTKKQTVYFAYLFLFIAALLREMGIQHWLTKTDSTAIKIHFFTNPNNPLSEKIITGLLVFLVLSVVLWLLIKHIRQIVTGFFKCVPLYWTVCTFGVALIICKIADRLPSRLVKLKGIHLSDYAMGWVTLFEEGLEATLPLLFALGLIQYHLSLKQKHKK